MRTVRSFGELVFLDVPTNNILKNSIGNWNINFITNDMREFLFKLRNNQLPLNNRVHAYDPDRDFRCSFCRIIDNDTNTRENFNHLFLTCPVTNNLLKNWVRLMEPRPDINSIEFRNLYWYGISVMEDDDHSISNLSLLFDFFKYILWKFKVRRQVPNFLMFREQLHFEIRVAMKKNTHFSRQIQGYNIIANLLPALG